MPSSDQQFVPNNVWASSTVQGLQEVLTLPTGQTCLARKMSVESVLQTGLIAQADVLTGIVDRYTRKVKGGNGIADGTPVIENELLKDPEALGTIVRVVDDLIPHIVVSPVVHRHWTTQTVGQTTVTKMIPAEERVPGQVYTDMIDLADKMELFDWSLGGLQSFSSFRGTPTGDVGSVGPVEKPRGKAKRRNRNR